MGSGVICRGQWLLAVLLLATVTSVQHATVVNVAPGRLIRMIGSLGPLQQAAVTGALSWEFEKKGSAASTLTVTYAAGGYSPGGLDKLADIVNTVLSRQVELLKAHAERAGGRR